jgi:hypothetical protein
VDVKHMEGEALQWASFFYTLRDGQPGSMQRVGKRKRSPIPPRSSSKWVGFASGEGTMVLPAEVVYRRNKPVRPLTNEPLGRPILIAVSEEARALPGGTVKMEGQDWLVFPPTFPKPEVWEQLKKARSVPQIEQAASGIGELEATFSSSTAWAQNPAGALSHFAEAILEAKRLPHYPRKSRARSDDKRIVFLAKVMAGLTLGLRPITAVKKLSRWRWPKDWAEKSLREFVERQSRIFQDQQGGLKKS